VVDLALADQDIVMATDNQIKKAVARAVRSSYGWKSPILETKGRNRSLVLQLVALSFFLLRLIWPLQFVKAVVRCVRRAHDIPPLVAELYLIAFIVAEGLACGILASEYGNEPPARWLIGCLCLWKVTETLTSNLYYLLFRPVLERNDPHSTYRSLVMLSLGCLEAWLLLSILWYVLRVSVGSSRGSIVDALFMVGSACFGHLAINVTATDGLSKGSCGGFVVCRLRLRGSSCGLLPWFGESSATARTSSDHGRSPSLETKLAAAAAPIASADGSGNHGQQSGQTRADRSGPVARSQR
jgi:hypothetical protein